MPDPRIHKAAHALGQYNIVYSLLNSLFRPAGQVGPPRLPWQPVPTVPLSEWEATPEVRMATTYGRALLPPILGGMGAAAPYLAAATAASPPFISYAASPVTRQRTAGQAAQLGRAWNWVADKAPISLPAAARWFSQRR